MFAGVGGFRCGLNGIETLADAQKPEKWDTVWFNEWEKWAHGVYVNRFGSRLDMDGKDTTNCDIHQVDKTAVPDHNLLVGGFPCQDYSVASTLATSKGLEGKKGVLWWDIRDMLEAKAPAFVLLENVDRLLKSPAKQRGRDFAIILACFRDLGYTVEWRVINAAEYGLQQRRRRTFLFAYRNDTAYAERIAGLTFYDRAGDCAQRLESMVLLLARDGFFAKSFPVDVVSDTVRSESFAGSIGQISDAYTGDFENTGVMKDGVLYLCRTVPAYIGPYKTVGDVLENGSVADSYFIPKDRLYYTSPDVTSCDETAQTLPAGAKRTWQYIKGGKRMYRKAANGYEYIYTEGAVPMIDEHDKPARTLLTSEGSFSRTTHIIRDKGSSEIRLLTSVETERIQGFPDNWTCEAVLDGKHVPVPDAKRRFMMGNALVVQLVSRMETELSAIFDAEP